MSGGLALHLTGGEPNSHPRPLIATSMALVREEKFVALVGVVVSISALTLATIDETHLQNYVRDAAAVGWIVDVSSDQCADQLRVLGIGFRLIQGPVILQRR